MLHAEIPSPGSNGFSVGPLYIHVYALMYIVGIVLAVLLGRRRWAATGGDPALVDEMALWGVPAGLIGGRLYFDITTPSQIQPHVWWGVFAIWKGGLGIWGGVALATVVCVWRLRKEGVSVIGMMDAVAPSLLIASGIGRIGNYFNQELFGKPTSWPWGLAISPAQRPPGYEQYAAFQPTFLYELIWDLAFAGLLIWLGRRRWIRPGGLFPLYVAGYSAFRVFEETIRIDYSQYVLGLRLNFFIALVMTLAGLAWFAVNQRRPVRAEPTAPTAPAGQPDGDGAESDAPGPRPRMSGPAGAPPAAAPPPA